MEIVKFLKIPTESTWLRGVHHYSCMCSIDGKIDLFCDTDHSGTYVLAAANERIKVLEDALKEASAPPP